MKLQVSAGFTVLQRQRGDEVRAVLVPEASHLPPEILDVVLRTAGMTHHELAHLLATDKSRPTQLEE